MRLLVVTNDFPPRVGGANAYVGEICRRFPAASTTVFASNWPGARAFDGQFPQEVVRDSSSMLLPTPGVRRAITDLVRTRSIDLVLFGASLPLAALGPALLRRGVPYAACTHGLELAGAAFPGSRGLLQRAWRDASLVTVVSHFMRDRLRPLIEPGVRLEILPSGVDTVAFRPDVSDAAIRARYRLGVGPVLSTVSRLVPRKGHDQVIAALPALRRRWPSLRYLIVGGGPDASRLEGLARRAGVIEMVSFAGEVPANDLPACFRAGDVFVMPCRERFFGLETEALGAVYLQAAAVGRASIGGAIGGVSDAVRHETTGLLVDGRDPTAVHRAIERLLGDPAHAEAMGRAGAAWVHAELRWETVAMRLWTWLTECLAARGSRTAAR